jgi:hypothetical protein
MRLGVAIRRRTLESIGLTGVAAAVIFVCTFADASLDTSESRDNSFPSADEQALKRVHAPLRIEVYLAPEDPRRVDLEHRALSKLRRVMPKVQVQYRSSTSIGLFEQTRDHYGEIWYDGGGGKNKVMSRATTAEGVLEAIYAASGTTPPKENEEETFRGHPLTAEPKGASVIYYGLWPACVAACAIFARRNLK